MNKRKQIHLPKTALFLKSDDACSSFLGDNSDQILFPSPQVSETHLYIDKKIWYNEDVSGMLSKSPIQNQIKSPEVYKKTVHPTTNPHVNAAPTPNTPAMPTNAVPGAPTATVAP